MTVVATITALALTLVVVGVFLLPGCVRALRAQAIGLAASHARYTGVTLRVPTIPGSAGTDFTARVRHTWTLVTDADTWRLLRWAAVDSCTGIGILLAVMPLGLIGWGLEGLIVMPALWAIFRITPTEWYAFIPVFESTMLPAAALLAIGFLALGWFTAPWWVRLHGHWAAALLGSEGTELRERVDLLATSRTHAWDDAAAELRRIEREVHDSTQSQLVVIGLTLGTAEALMEDDPERARELVAKARDDSTTALAELRDLIRGIRPPILADRGLAAALESLALDATTTVTTRIELPKSLDPALESAVYFAARELLTNALKHAAATRITIDAQADTTHLAVTVIDDGTGCATILPGHGLDGVRRRLAAFDGTLSVTSPTGGPTSVRIEVPCGL